jgi:hypothetical protein
MRKLLRGAMPCAACASPVQRALGPAGREGPERPRKPSRMPPRERASDGPFIGSSVFNVVGRKRESNAHSRRGRHDDPDGSAWATALVRIFSRRILMFGTAGPAARALQTLFVRTLFRSKSRGWSGSSMRPVCVGCPPSRSRVSALDDGTSSPTKSLPGAVCRSFCVTRRIRERVALCWCDTWWPISPGISSMPASMYARNYAREGPTRCTFTSRHPINMMSFAPECAFLRNSFAWRVALENHCWGKLHRGFKSLSLRQCLLPAPGSGWQQVRSGDFKEKMDELPWSAKAASVYYVCNPRLSCGSRESIFRGTNEPPGAIDGAGRVPAAAPRPPHWSGVRRRSIEVRSSAPRAWPYPLPATAAR